MDARSLDPEIVGGQPPVGFQLDIRAHGFALTDALRQYATDHIAAKLAKHARAIESVVIRFEDINGSKGGVDKCCRIEVLISGTHPLVVEEVEDDLRAAMDRAADRIQTVVGRELTRRRATPRQRGRKMVRDRKTSH
jgi:putative sigma-54 modulation protein